MTYCRSERDTTVSLSDGKDLLELAQRELKENVLSRSEDNRCAKNGIWLQTVY